jgi:hypothetical protein
MNDNLGFVGFEYINLHNLGDYIQSIASERLLPQEVGYRINRENLCNIKMNNQSILIMNGWFSHNIKNSFPPPASIKPIFWGFHISQNQHVWDYLKTSKCLNYLKNHAPIGCRDRVTMEILEFWGIDSFYSKCLSLTLPLRTKTKNQNWYIITDVPFKLPDDIENRGIRVTQRLAQINYTEKHKWELANNLLDLYKNCAKHVITTRLHTALPCHAMGIPVSLIGDGADYRYQTAIDAGVRFYDTRKFNNTNDLLNNINWNLKPINFENEKSDLISKFNKHLGFVMK